MPSSLAAVCADPPCLYCCSKTCQKKDWKQRHKHICEFLNAGDGALQIQHKDHAEQRTKLDSMIAMVKGSRDPFDLLLWQLFEDSSTPGESEDAARKMKVVVALHSDYDKRAMMMSSLSILIRADPKMLLQANSPLLVFASVRESQHQVGARARAIESRRNSIHCSS
jgi:hypothetical protein